MFRMKFIFIAWLCLGFNQGHEFETAYYEVSTDRERTSPIIQSGKLRLKVIEEVSSDNTEPLILKAELNYDFQLFKQHLKGAEILDIPVRYLSEDYLEILREKLNYEAPAQAH